MNATMSSSRITTGPVQSPRGTPARRAQAQRVGDSEAKTESGKQKAEMACPTGWSSLEWGAKRDMPLASFFAGKRQQEAAEGHFALADGLAGDLALIEVRGLLAQAEGRAA